MILEKGYCRLEHSGFVHFSIITCDHCAELIDQHIELVSPLFLAKITGPPRKKIVITIYFLVRVLVRCLRTVNVSM